MKVLLQFGVAPIEEDLIQRSVAMFEAEHIPASITSQSDTC